MQAGPVAITAYSRRINLKKIQPHGPGPRGNAMQSPGPGRTRCNAGGWNGESTGTTGFITRNFPACMREEKRKEKQ